MILIVHRYLSIHLFASLKNYPLQMCGIIIIWYMFLKYTNVWSFTANSIFSRFVTENRGTVVYSKFLKLLQNKKWIGDNVMREKSFHFHEWITSEFSHLSKKLSTFDFFILALYGSKCLTLFCLIQWSCKRCQFSRDLPCSRG